VNDLPDASILAKTHFAKSLVGLMVGVESGDSNGLAAVNFLQSGFDIGIHSQVPPCIADSATAFFAEIALVCAKIGRCRPA
jgi:hypothetical protein